MELDLGGEGGKGGETLSFLQEDLPPPSHNSAGPVLLRTNARTYRTWVWPEEPGQDVVGTDP